VKKYNNIVLFCIIICLVFILGLFIGYNMVYEPMKQEQEYKVVGFVGAKVDSLVTEAYFECSNGYYIKSAALCDSVIKECIIIGNNAYEAKQFVLKLYEERSNIK